MPAEEILENGAHMENEHEGKNADEEQAAQAHDQAAAGLGGPWNWDSQEAIVDSDADPDVYRTRSLDADLAHTKKQSKGSQESAVDLPDIMTESYDEDPEVVALLVHAL